MLILSKSDNPSHLFPVYKAMKQTAYPLYPHCPHFPQTQHLQGFAEKWLFHFKNVCAIISFAIKTRSGE
jgi:hypothetical protein